MSRAFRLKLQLVGLLLAALALGALGTGARNALAETPPSDSVRVFDENVRPILKSHCFKCHGRDEPQAGLDLSSAAGVLKGSENGPVVVDGSPDKSPLYQKISTRMMPPPEEKDPLSKDQVSVIYRWIAGRKAVAPARGGVVRAKRPEVTEKDREFWSFRRPVSPPLPAVHEPRFAKTPIDVFLLAKLESKGLSFSAEASKTTLLRRAYLDLIGLPPSPQEVKDFLADTRSDAYERLVDRLLDSPQYGERWGRHWLDVAGYTDAPHTDAQGDFLPIDDWRYRDYVVRALNTDKPFDRFIQEQLAGDEMVDWRNSKQYTPEIVDALAATGYLRTTPDLTHGDQMQAPKYRYDTLAAVVENVSTGLMGLTMGCVRCHSHKFDPIPHADYYRLMAVFATAYNPAAWKRPNERSLPDLSPADQAEAARRNAQIAAARAECERKLEALRRPHRERLFIEKLRSIPVRVRADFRKALETPALKRDSVQRSLVGKFGLRATVSLTDVKRDYSDAERKTDALLEREAAHLKESVRSYGSIQALWDAGPPPIIHELMRGNADTLGPPVDPGFVTVLCRSGHADVVRPADTKGNSSGRRLAFARWLTGRNHPLTARVFVNRMWLHHFGKGIVATPENFGHSGMRPTHPALLDWMAVDFMEHGWRIKRMHKMMMCSTAYRQLAARSPDARGNTVDPENDLLWRMNLRRLDAEVLRDSVLAVSGKLDATMGGPPLPLEANADGLVTAPETGPTPTSRWRRSLYLRELRGSHPSGKGFKLSMLEIFDYPEIVINCTQRMNSTTPLQSLALVNSDFMREQARRFAEHLRALTGPGASTTVQIDAAFIAALGRRAQPDEIRVCTDHLRRQTEEYLKLAILPEEASRRALASLCLILFASNEFLYIG